MSGVLTFSNAVSWSLQAALIVTAALVALRILRLEEPGARYVMLRGVLALCLVLPPAGLWLAGAAPAGGAVASVVAAGLDTAPAPAAGSLLALSLQRDSWRAPLAAVLAAGIVARLGWLAIGISRLRRLRRLGEVAAADPGHEALQSAIGTRAAVRYVKGLGQPVTFGLRAPVVLLPASLQARPAPVREAVLAHELWHVRRRDWMWTVAEEALRAVCWFHPAIWVLITRIQAAREEVVDHLTVLATGSRRRYVEALLAYADEPALFHATAFAERHHLVRRIRLISREEIMSARRVVGSCAAAALVSLSAGWYALEAFPLVQAAGASEIFSAVPGQLEASARPVTPENPVPRRSFFVAPEYPLEAETIEARGSVTVRVTLDASGNVAEARVTNLWFSLGDAGGGFSSTAGSSLENLVGRFPADRRPGVRTAIEAFGRAALGAVRQWQYDPPADPPISFAVSVPFAPPGTSAASVPPPIAPPPGGRHGDPASLGQLGPQDAVRVGGNVKAPVKIRHVNPVYPEEARNAGLQGVVILEVLIERDGTVADARVLRSIPMLDEAALEAVMQWMFVPTLLNGEPVPVSMTVTVNFTLAQ